MKITDPDTSLLDTEEKGRKIQLLRTLLIIIGSFLFVMALWASWSLFNNRLFYDGISPAPLFIGVAGFICLWFLLARGWITIVSWFVISTLALGSIYCSFTWGPTLPFSLLLITLTTLTIGLLLHSTHLKVSTVIAVVVIIISGYGTIYEPEIIDSTWRSEAVGLDDVFQYIIIFMVIFGITALSQQKSTNALLRALTSEQSLKEERDNLENIVTKRTESLRSAYHEHLVILNRNSEYHRKARTFIHDIAGPLTTFSFLIETVITHGKKPALSLKEVRHMKIIQDHIQGLISTLSIQETEHVEINVREEIESCIALLSYDLIAHSIHTVHNLHHITPRIYGDSTAFRQILCNLMSNSINALEESTEERMISIAYEMKDSFHIISLQDNGCGISNDIIPHIFKPEFSTKSNTHHMGIGLTTTKFLIEDRFGGSLRIESKENHGTICTLHIPHTKKLLSQ
jgi:signal transduction histidine kinase